MVESIPKESLDLNLVENRWDCLFEQFLRTIYKPTNSKTYQHNLAVCNTDPVTLSKHIANYDIWYAKSYWSGWHHQQMP